MSQFETRIARDDADVHRYGQIISSAFQFPSERATTYCAAIGHENIRVVGVDGDFAGGLASIPCDQYFGGRAIPMAGIAAVAIAPEFRSVKAAHALMRAELESLHARRVPLSALYPATNPLYRGVGYESAGGQAFMELDCSRIDLRERELALQPATDADEPDIRALYEQWARPRDGNLRRTEFFWRRVHVFRTGDVATGYVLRRGGQLEGYLFAILKSGGSGAQEIRLTDLVATTPAAARRILTFLGQFRSQVQSVAWMGWPTEDVLLSLREQIWRIRDTGVWMLRIVHVEEALQARGYPAGVNADLHFRVRDDILPGNSGDFRLEVRDGCGRVERGGRGALEIDIRGLAPLYSGFHSPEELAARGYLSALPEELSAARAAFAGPAPWMRDPF